MYFMSHFLLHQNHLKIESTVLKIHFTNEAKKSITLGKIIKIIL